MSKKLMMFCILLSSTTNRHTRYPLLLGTLTLNPKVPTYEKRNGDNAYGGG